MTWKPLAAREDRRRLLVAPLLVAQRELSTRREGTLLASSVRSSRGVLGLVVAVDRIPLAVRASEASGQPPLVVGEEVVGCSTRPRMTATEPLVGTVS